MSCPEPSLTVVVIGRNEGPRLSRCLQSVQAMQWSGPLDVIYVDSNSSDDSRERAQALGATVLSATQERPCAAAGRNIGWRASSAELVLFLDGDTVLHPDFSRQAWIALQEPSVAVVWGHRRELYPEHSWYIRVLDLDWIYAPGPTPFCGGDALMRRNALAIVDGFDATLIAGEEPELCQRLRAESYQIIHIDQPMTDHDLAIHCFSQYWQRAVRAGHAYAEVADRFRDQPYSLWQHEVSHNRRHGLVLLAIVLLGGLGTLLSVSPWPLLLAALMLIALVVRTAWRARWKSQRPFTLVLYGVHSHLQKLPILFGQWRYHRQRRRGRLQSLIEYK